MKKIFVWIYKNRVVRKMFLVLIAFDILYSGAVLIGFKMPESKPVIYATASSTPAVVTNEEAAYVAVWLKSDAARTLAEHEYLTAKKAEIEKALNDNRSLSLK